MKRVSEDKLVALMLRIYCKKKHSHHEKKTVKRYLDGDEIYLIDFCDDCIDLWDYVVEKNKKCPRKSIKTFCSTCPIHCYERGKREEIRKVMKYSGKWMMLYHPRIALAHIIDEIMEKRGKNV